LRNSLQITENRLERAKSQTLQAMQKQPVQTNGSATPPVQVKEEPVVEVRMFL
jgi:hypothetical protein